MPIPNGPGTAVIRVASAACYPCGEFTDAWGLEANELEDVEAVGPCSAQTPDGARARTFLGLVAAVARDRGGRVVLVAVLWVEEEEELWWGAPQSIILATTELPYVPGRGGRTFGCWAHCANGERLPGRGMPLHVR